MTFRLVATDLDGTLLHTDYDVSATTVDVLRRVQEAGALVVPVTARGPWSVREVAAEFGLRGYAICSSGATIYDLARAQTVEEVSLAAGSARKMVEALRAAVPGVAFACTHGSEGYAREETYLPGVPPPPGFPSPPGSWTGRDILEFLETDVHKLVAKVPGLTAEELLALVRPHITEDAICGTSGGAFVELLATSATKLAALQRLCERTGVRREEVVAFGDWTSDAPMLEWAGLGVAPANALPEARAAADEVCDSNDEDGVARVLERLLDAGLIAR